MKRLFAILLALIMIMSLSVTAFATEGEENTDNSTIVEVNTGTGSIVITNANLGDTYKLYKIFEATYTPYDATTQEAPDAVSYTVTNDTIYNYMFGDGAPNVSYNAETGVITNGVFDCVVSTKVIYKHDSVDNNKENVFAYLETMVRYLETNTTYTYDATAETVQTSKVEFQDVAFGYYLIDKEAESGVDVAVTITSNTPDVNVIDKNQKPASEFDKLVWDEDTEQWVTDTSAEVGDILEFKVEFTATNYDGDKRVEYYSIMDTKGTALWIEFEDITVTVDGVPLTKGYYHGAAGPNGNTEHLPEAGEPFEWDFIGDGWDEDDAKNDPQDAEWYLIHYGFDQIEIVIPWLEDHTFTGTTSGFGLEYSEATKKDPESARYGSPVTVVVGYTASVEPNATIGDHPTNTQSNNLWNTAKLTWNPTASQYPGESTTEASVYALGMHKVDDATGASLAGAEFGLFYDEDCENPVHVIWTGIPGVYMVDDLLTDITGEKRSSARKMYAEWLDDYLGEGHENDGTQKYKMVTGDNGKLVVLGLEAGEYYLKETVAPNGYNILPAAQTVTVGATTETFDVIVDSNNNPVDTDRSHMQDGYVIHSWNANSVVVSNSKGVQLPSTGGKGTVMLITFGTMVAIGFAVLMITQKKMTIYHD